MSYIDIEYCEDDQTEEDFELEAQEEPKPDYKNSCPLDIQLYSVHKEVIDTATFLCEAIAYKKDRAIDHMRMVILNLFWVHSQSKERWIGYTRDKNNYDLVFRYNKQRITYTYLMKVIDGLLDKGYITHKIGYRGKGWKTGICSKMQATTKLIELMQNNGITVDMISRHPQEERIFLKDDKKRLIDYPDTRKTSEMRKFLSQYNELLMKSYIDLDTLGYEIVKDAGNRQIVYGPKYLYVDLSKKRVWRVFNNGSFKEGGRFYGGWWMGVPSDLRKRIIINGQKVVECDYSGMHIHLLYAMEGINYGLKKEDPYNLPKYNGDPKYRKLFKLLMLISINAYTEKDTIKSLRNKINFDRTSFPENIPDLKVLIQEFKSHHKPIAKYISKGVGTKLMYQDATIAEHVLKVMTSRKIPILSVHDSFICPKEYTNELFDVMENAFTNVASKLSKVIDIIKIDRKEIIEIFQLTGNEDDYCYDPPYCNITIMESILSYLERGIVLPHIAIVKVPLKYI